MDKTFDCVVVGSCVLDVLVSNPGLGTMVRVEIPLSPVTASPAPPATDGALA